MESKLIPYLILIFLMGVVLADNLIKRSGFIFKRDYFSWFLLLLLIILIKNTLGFILGFYEIMAFLRAFFNLSYLLVLFYIFKNYGRLFYLGIFDFLFVIGIMLFFLNVIGIIGIGHHVGPNIIAVMLLPSLIGRGELLQKGAFYWIMGFVAFAISIVIEARGVSMVLIIYWSMLIVRNKRTIIFGVSSVVILLLVVTFYLGFREPKLDLITILLTNRPIIWSYYISHLEGVDWVIGKGIITEEISFGASQLVSQIANRGVNEEYGPHNTIIGFLYLNGLPIFLFFMVILWRGIRAKFYNLNLFLSSMVIMIFFTSTEIGGISLFGFLLSSALLFSSKDVKLAGMNPNRYQM